MTDLFVRGNAGKLAIRAKGLGSSRKVVVLVQGANITGQLGFDFSFAGGRDYSLMDSLVSQGFAAVTFSLRGYGQSTAPENPLTVNTDAALEDLGSVMDWLAAGGYDAPHLAGWSWGGRIVGRYAEAHPQRIDRLALLDPALGGGQLIPFDGREPWWTNSFEYFMNRLEDRYMDPVAKRALAVQASTNELHSPNGIRLENAQGSRPVDPGRIKNPTLMLYGEGAGQQNYMKGAAQRSIFFEALATHDKWLAIVPDGGDYAHLQNARLRFQAVLGRFLSA